LDSRKGTKANAGTRFAPLRLCVKQTFPAPGMDAPGNVARGQKIDRLQAMFGGSSPAAIAARLNAIAHTWVADGPAERADRARRKLLSAISGREPATLNQIAASVGRGAPAVSRSVDSLVRAGLVERTQDPDNRRRLALRLTESGRDHLNSAPTGSLLAARLERLAHSELRAIERAIEILER
jgi:DNA-binding MarR family transcriptional regulator